MILVCYWDSKGFPSAAGWHHLNIDFALCWWLNCAPNLNTYYSYAFPAYVFLLKFLLFFCRKPVEHFLKIVEGVTAKDIASIAQKLISSPLTMASYGDGMLWVQWEFSVLLYWFPSVVIFNGYPLLSCSHQCPKLWCSQQQVQVKIKIDIFFPFWCETGQASYLLFILLCICIPLKLFYGQLQSKIREIFMTLPFLWIIWVLSRQQF